MLKAEKKQKQKGKRCKPQQVVVMKQLQRIIKKHFGINASPFIVGFVEFKRPFGPIEAKCRIYAVFADEQVLFTRVETK